MNRINRRTVTRHLSRLGLGHRRFLDPTGSGVDVVDIEVHPAGSGFAAFERARACGYVDGWAWLVRTPSGGVHAYFLRSESGVQRSWQVPKAHIDFRGDGGYIVLPPSRIAAESGAVHRYELIAVAQHTPHPVDAGALRRFLDPVGCNFSVTAVTRDDAANRIVALVVDWRTRPAPGGANPDVHEPDILHVVRAPQSL